MRQGMNGSILVGAGQNTQGCGAVLAFVLCKLWIAMAHPSIEPSSSTNRDTPVFPLLVIYSSIIVISRSCNIFVCTFGGVCLPLM